MAWMLQPRSYRQIPRPNLYNVAYRRVATYKGMGRGPVTGQYNTFSGQLQYWPPGLSGLGQSDQVAADYAAIVAASPETTQMLLNAYNQATATPAAPAATTPTTSSFGQWFQQYGVYVAVGVAVVALMAGGRR